MQAFQDLTGSGHMERTALGLPSEPYAFSGGSSLGRPSFESAAIALTGDAPASLSTWEASREPRERTGL